MTFEIKIDAKRDYSRPPSRSDVRKSWWLLAWVIVVGVALGAPSYLALRQRTKDASETPASAHSQSPTASSTSTEPSRTERIQRAKLTGIIAVGCALGVLAILAPFAAMLERQVARWSEGPAATDIDGEPLGPNHGPASDSVDPGEKPSQVQH